jgi:glycosyltransferase involved in cell wall biosynthesis
MGTAVQTRPVPRPQTPFVRRRAVFERLVDVACQRVRSSPEIAAVYAQAAADYAWTNHTGAYGSLRLEELLHAIAASVPPPPRGPAAARSAPPEEPRHVLHVLTEAHATGGHTRLAWRWVAKDGPRMHSIAVTGQASIPVPHQLERAVRASGGEVHHLGGVRVGLLERARRLRGLAAGVDQVLLHVNPFDVVPAIALADKTATPPAAIVNHADHVFWTGAGIAESVIHFRERSVELSVRRRGIRAERTCVVPVPLEPLHAEAPSREDARRRIGLQPDAFVVLSIGAGYKFREEGRVVMPDLLGPAMAANEDAVFLAVGPEPDPAWLAARSRTDGRVRALGPQPDVAVYLRAADVFVDPYPQGSLTALLEAGLAGLPCVRLRYYEGEAALMEPDDPGLSETLIKVSGAEQLAEVLSELRRDPLERAARGSRCRDALEQRHVGEGWHERVRAAYALTASVPRMTDPSELSPRGAPTSLDEAVALHLAGSPAGRRVRARIGEHCRTLPPRSRRRALRELDRLVAMDAGTGGRDATVSAMIKAFAPMPLVNLLRRFRLRLPALARR